MADNNSSSWLKHMAWGSVIATSLAGLVGGGYLLGSFIDSRWGTNPLFRIALMLFGVDRKSVV